MGLMPLNRAPTHPGEMLLEEFLRPLGLTQRDLATAIGVSYPESTSSFMASGASHRIRRCGSPSFREPRRSYG